MIHIVQNVLLFLAKVPDNAIGTSKTIMIQRITTIHLNPDNDEVGRGAAEGIMLGLPGKYTVPDEPPALGCKDVNDRLKQTVGIIKRRNTFER